MDIFTRWFTWYAMCSEGLVLWALWICGNSALSIPWKSYLHSMNRIEIQSMVESIICFMCYGSNYHTMKMLNYIENITGSLMLQIQWNISSTMNQIKSASDLIHIECIKNNNLISDVLFQPNYTEYEAIAMVFGGNYFKPIFSKTS